MFYPAFFRFEISSASQSNPCFPQSMNAGEHEMLDTKYNPTNDTNKASLVHCPSHVSLSPSSQSMVPMHQPDICVYVD